MEAGDLAWTVCVASVADASNGDATSLVVDGVEDAPFPHDASCVDAVVRRVQRLADPAGIVSPRSDDEVGGTDCHIYRQLLSYRAAC